MSWPLVEYNPGKRERNPLLYFDIGFDPEAPQYVWLRRRDTPYRDYNWDSAKKLSVSTHCDVDEMTIILDGFLGWPVVVKRKSGLQCLDVLREIYRTFNKRLTREEIAMFGESYIDRCRPAFLQRCKDSPGLEGYNVRQGMLRVDMLRGRRIFSGLVQSGAVWKLKIDQLSR